MQAYEPSDRVSPLGWPLLLIAAVGGGALLGVITFFVSQAFYLVLLFPLLLGLLDGLLIGGAIYVGKVRSPSIAVFFAVLIAVVTYGTYHYAGYYDFRRDLRHRIEKAYGAAITDNDYQLYERASLQDETGSRGFVGYMKLQAKYGFQISSTTASKDSGGITFKGPFAYGYWVIELIIMGIASAVVSFKQAGQPFSEETNDWFGKQLYLATVPGSASGAVVEALKQGQYARAGSCLYMERALSIPRFEVTLRRSRSQGTYAVLSVRSFWYDNRKRPHTKVFLEGLISTSDLAALTSAIRRPA